MFLVFRIISALSGAGAFSVVGGSLSDLWLPEERAPSMSFFAATTLIGPCFGPVLGSLIVANLNWRWVFHIQTIYAAIVLIFVIFTLPETFVPKLAQKAHRLERIHTDAPSLSKRIRIALQRPISMTPVILD